MATTGSAKRAAALDPALLSGSDKLQVLGAMLRDAGAAYNGQQSDNLAQLHQMMAAQQEKAKQDAAVQKFATAFNPQYQDSPAPQVAAPTQPAPLPSLGGLTPQAPAPAPYTYQPPTRLPGLNIASPRLLPQMLQGLADGVPAPMVTSALDVLKAQQPDVRYDRGFGYNSKTGEGAGGFHPDLDKGQTLGPDGAVINLPGAVRSATDMAGSVAGAQEGAKSAFDLVDVPQSDGSTRKMTRFQAAQMLSGQGGALPPGLGVSQTPAAKVTAEGTAKTGVERAAAQPQNFSGLQDQARTTDNVLGFIDKALKQIGPLSTGFAANLSGIKGFQAHDLQATLDTIRGNVGFDRLQQMRNNSPTGGALGQVSEQENKLLQSVLGSLDQGQSADQLRQNLSTVRDQLAAVSAQRKSIYDQMYGGAASAKPVPASQLPAHDAMVAEARKRGLIK